MCCTGGKEVRSQFADQDQQTREDMKREKRRIQDQLRRLKKQEEKVVKKKKPQKQKPLTTINVSFITPLSPHLPPPPSLTDEMQCLWW